MIIDRLGEILWFAMFATPLLTIPFAWKWLSIKKIYRVVVGLLLAVILSFILYYLSLGIIFRNGMGSGQ
jgi:hypothetical protein